MSSPSGVSDETRSQDSVHASSQFAIGSGTFRYRVFRAPHWTIAGRLLNSNESSPQRRIFAWDGGGPSTLRITGAAKVTVSLGLIGRATTMCTLAEQTASTAISGVGRVEAETCRVREMVEATTAEARSVRGEVESCIATLAAAADASATRTTEEIASRVKEVAEYSNAQALRVAADVTQRLEHEIVAAATSTTATAKVTTRTVVEGVRRDIQAQIEQNRVDALRREQEAQHRV